MIDANGWDDCIADAPKGAKDLWVIVPFKSENGKDGFFYCQATWIPKLSGGYWDGDWRRYVGRIDGEPTHWKRLGVPVAYQAKEEAA